MTKTQVKPGYLLALTTAPAVPIEAQRDLDGTPARRFRKELIRAGQFVKQSQGMAFEVDRRTLDHWAATFSQMRGRGLKVPVPLGHKEVVNEEDSLGWVQEMFVEGDSLIGIVDLVGDDAMRMANTKDVSIYAPAEHIDALGNNYEWPILHVALCIDPVIPGLGDFIQIAASKGQTPARVPVLRLQENVAMPIDLADPTGGPPAPANDPIKEAFKAKINEAIDDDGLDLKATLARIKEILTAQEKAMGLLSNEKPAAPAEPAIDAAGIVAASQGPKPDPMLLSLAAQNYGMKLDQLVAGGRITSKVREQLATQFFGPENKTLALSLAAKTTAQIDATLDALAENDPVALKEHTGGQVLALSNPSRGAEPLSKETQTYMEQAAGVPQPA